MNLPEFLQDSHTVLFLLILVLLVSVWISRTYRAGKFSRWIAPSEGYGTGIIEGLTQETTYLGEAYSSADAAGSSSSAGVLILNKCTQVVNTDTAFRFFFTPAKELTGGIITISIPTSHIQLPSGVGITLKESSITTAAAKTTTTISGTNLDPTASQGIVVTTPASGQPGAGNYVITYTIKTTSAIPKDKQYALELTGVKWSTSAVPATTDAFVTLSSSKEDSGKEKLVNVYVGHASDATKRVKIFKDTTFDFEQTYLSCRKITTEDPTLSPGNAGEALTFTMNMMLTNGLKGGDQVLIQLPFVIKYPSADIIITVVNGSDRLATFGNITFTLKDSNVYEGGQNSLYFNLGTGNADVVLLPPNVTLKLIITGIYAEKASGTVSNAKILTFRKSATSIKFTDNSNVLDAGQFTFPEIIKAKSNVVTTGGATSTGTASDGTTYVTSAAASVLISYVKDQMKNAVRAQKDYEAAYQKLRSATSQTAKNDAQDAYDKAVAIRNRLIASHPDSWYDGANWRYGDDGYIRKCIEPSTLSTNEGNCQNIFRMDASGNLVKTADGNNILLMKKCPWKCNNPGQSGSDACRIDADCLKVTQWATYLPDGTQIEKNLLGTSATRANYDAIASDSSSSALSDDDIYKRGITRNFNGYGRRQPGGEQQERHGLFGSIRDATGNIIRGIGNWIDPNDPNSGKRTAKHNAYYYEDGSPAATAYLGMYNGQGYEEESPFNSASKPMNYYYTTNYYYTNGEAGGDGRSNMPGAMTKVMPYEQNINL